MEALRERVKALEDALAPFASGGPWGTWKAYLTHGPETKEHGIAAAKQITYWQVAVDAAFALPEPEARHPEAARPPRARRGSQGRCRGARAVSPVFHVYQDPREALERAMDDLANAAATTDTATAEEYERAVDEMDAARARIRALVLPEPEARHPEAARPPEPGEAAAGALGSDRADSTPAGWVWAKDWTIYGVAGDGVVVPLGATHPDNPQRNWLGFTPATLEYLLTHSPEEWCP